MMITATPEVDHHEYEDLNINYPGSDASGGQPLFFRTWRKNVLNFRTAQRNSPKVLKQSAKTPWILKCAIRLQK